jgi:hypothetical protein
LTARQVATVLEQTATGRGFRTPAAGYGVLNVAAAVAAAQGRPVPAPTGAVVVESVQTRASAPPATGPVALGP